jgi:alpha/beta superfamily hydrolase
MAEPFLIGSGDQQLFAVYHPPADSSAEVATLICPPLFADFARSQPALREIAISLADAGQHAIRFDYRGTGDSYGVFEEVRLSGLVEDVQRVVAEALELLGDIPLRFLGVRLSAIILAAAAGELSNADRFVLWDPVLSGEAYLDAMRRKHQEAIAADYYLDKRARARAREQFGSHRISEAFQMDLAKLDRTTYEALPRDRLAVVSTDEASVLLGARTESVRFDCKWDATVEDLMMPQPVLERVLQCLI